MAGPRTRDLWDVLTQLDILAHPEISTPTVSIDEFQPVSSSLVFPADSMAILNDGHSGTYLWDNATTLWQKFQYG